MLSRFVNRAVVSQKLPNIYFARTAAAATDTKFERPKRLEYPSPVRHGFIPEEFFTFFYPKTGVTGPYVFGISLSTYLVSKELYVLEHEFYSGLSLFMVMYVIIKKLGPPTAAFLDKSIDDEEKMYEAGRAAEIEMNENTIAAVHKEKWRCEAIPMILEAKKNNIALQLEAAYRERVQKVYEEVKKRLDYQVQLIEAERRLSQKHMVSWIVENVKKAFTPEQEKIVLQKCISDLQGLVKA